MKYVMGVCPVTGRMVPVVFDDCLTHSVLAAALHLERKVVRSAGFVLLVTGTWCVQNDKSESLGIGPHPEDEKILRMVLGKGCSGLDLMNMMAYEELTKAKRKRRK